MERPNPLAKAAHLLSVLAFLLSFFPLATLVGVVLHDPDLMYRILLGGIYGYFPVAALALVGDVFAGDGAGSRPGGALWGDRLAGGRFLFANPTMRSSAAAWLARSGIAVLAQLILILVGLVVLVVVR